MKLLVYIKHVSVHHATHSGYYQLIKHIEPAHHVPTQSFLPLRIRKLLSSKSHQGLGMYDSDSVNKEIELAAWMLKHQNGTAHFLNGERDIRFTTYLKHFRNWKFVATFHKPPEILESTFTSFKYIRQLDAVICVGPNQIDYFKNKIGIDKVAFIPLGVDTDFFKPDAKAEITSECLFVGQHLRDFKGLGQIIQNINNIHPNFKLTAVLREDAVHKLPKLPCIKVFSGISDEKLRTLYQTSSCLLLPFSKDPTAASAITEALACGLPIVTNDMGGVRGYLDEQCSFLMKQGDYFGMANAVNKLMVDHGLNSRMRSICRNKSLFLDWKNVSKKVQSFYDEIGQ